MHTYNNMLFREHQSVFKETFLLLTLTQFSSPEIPTVTSSLYIFSETVYACVCVCVCVCLYMYTNSNIFLQFVPCTRPLSWRSIGPEIQPRCLLPICLLCVLIKYIQKKSSGCGTMGVGIFAASGHRFTPWSGTVSYRTQHCCSYSIGHNWSFDLIPDPGTP